MEKELNLLLTAHLEVGGTTTMAEVVEILTNSNLIVEP